MANLLSAEGTKKGTANLNAAWFSVEPNIPLLHQVVTAQLAAKRAGTQSTKTRAEVRGGGRKPFKQKGTGRARQGSTRSPNQEAGGVALGPKPRSYSQKTPKKMITAALAGALTDRNNSDRLVVIDSVEGWQEPKTKQALAFLDGAGLTGKVLVVLDDENANEYNAYLSFRNIENVHVVIKSELNAYDVVCSDWVVFTQSSLPDDVVAEPAPKAEKVTKKTTKATKPKAAEKTDAASSSAKAADEEEVAE